MNAMTTQKAMQMYESLSKNNQRFVYSQMEKLLYSNKSNRLSLIGFLGLLSLKIASISKPSKNQYSETEIDELVSRVGNGKN